MEFAIRVVNPVQSAQRTSAVQEPFRRRSGRTAFDLRSRDSNANRRLPHCRTGISQQAPSWEIAATTHCKPSFRLRRSTDKPRMSLFQITHLSPTMAACSLVFRTLQEMNLAGSPTLQGPRQQKAVYQPRQLWRGRITTRLCGNRSELAVSFLLLSQLRSCDSGRSSQTYGSTDPDTMHEVGDGFDEVGESAPPS